jgi:hypothetical protein
MAAPLHALAALIGMVQRNDDSVRQLWSGSGRLQAEVAVLSAKHTPRRLANAAPLPITREGMFAGSS